MAQTGREKKKTLRIIRTSMGMGHLLDRTSKFQPKRISVTVNQSIKNHGLMRNVQNWLIKESRLNYSGVYQSFLLMQYRIILLYFMVSYKLVESRVNVS
jgi:hypothetical protein